jgi:HK97 gp10 family phage protein
MTLRNRARLLRKLAAIQGAPRAAMRKALAQNAAEITEMQKRLAPVDSGDLRDSIGFTFGKYRAANANVRGVAGGDGAGDPDLSVTIHAGDEKAFYAAFLEFGAAGPWQVGGRFAGATHPGFSAEPYFYPAWRALRRRSKSRLTRAMRKAIKDAAQ